MISNFWSLWLKCSSHCLASPKPLGCHSYWRDSEGVHWLSEGRCKNPDCHCLGCGMCWAGSSGWTASFFFWLTKAYDNCKLGKSFLDCKMFTQKCCPGWIGSSTDGSYIANNLLQACATPWQTSWAVTWWSIFLGASMVILTKSFC